MARKKGSRSKDKRAQMVRQADRPKTAAGGRGKAPDLGRSLEEFQRSVRAFATQGGAPVPMNNPKLIIDSGKRLADGAKKIADMKTDKDKKTDDKKTQTDKKIDDVKRARDNKIEKDQRGGAKKSSARGASTKLQSALKKMRSKG